MYMVFQEKHLFKNINYALKIKQLYEMLYIFGKPLLGHICIKYLKLFFLKHHIIKVKICVFVM